MKPNNVGFIMEFLDVNLDIHNQKQNENRKVVRERKQEQSTSNACREIPIVFSYKFGFPISKRKMKPNEVGLIMDFVDLNLDMQC